MGIEDDWYREAERERKRRAAAKASEAFDPWMQNKQVNAASWLFVLLVIAGLIGSWYVFENRSSHSLSRTSADAAQPAVSKALSPTPEVPAVPQAATNSSYEQHPQTCRIVDTAPVKTVSSKIFRWKDANGQWHFSDRRSGDEAVSDQSEQIVTRQQKLSVAVGGLGLGVSPLLRDKVQSHARVIYNFLAEPLGQNQLRHADIRVHLVADRDAFLRAYGRLKPGQLAPSGFYTSKTNEAFVLVNSDRQQAEMVAVHETAHVIMAALYQKTPLWLNEGVAEYWALSANTTGKARQVRWIQVLRQEGLMNLDQLFSISSDEWKRLPPSKSYANAWAVLAYLAQTDRGRATLNKILTSIAEEPCGYASSGELIDRWYPGGAEVLQKEVRGWLRSV